MSIEKDLFEGKHIRLAPIDHENHPQVEARWTHDPIRRASQMKDVCSDTSTRNEDVGVAAQQGDGPNPG